MVLLFALLQFPESLTETRLLLQHSTNVAIGNCPSCPGGLLTFQRRGEVWVILSNNSHFTGEVLMWAVPSTECCGLQWEFWCLDVLFKTKSSAKK